MSLSELRSALGGSLVLEGPVEGGCRYARPGGECTGLHFMLVDGVLARIDVDDGDYPTISGARVGDSEERVQALYKNRLEVSRHAYVEGHYLRLVSGDGKSALVFETERGTVVQIRIGRLPEADYIEGCL
jgi:hypothetical protein